MEFPKLVSLLITLMKKRISLEELKKWINFKSNSGYTALHYASYRGNNDVISLLIDNGACIDIKNDEGLNVLHLAAQGNRTASLIFFIEKYKLEFMMTDNIGSTPYHWASYVGAEESLMYLLTLNPDINKQDLEGLTPLHLAVTSERTKIIKKLIYAGADKTIKDKHNRTPLDLAIEKKKNNIAELLIKNNCCQFCAVKLPNQKLQKSRQNIFSFIILHILVESLTFFAILPCNFDHYLDYDTIDCFLVLLLTNCFLFTNFVSLIYSDPGLLINKKRLTLLQIVESKQILKDYCLSCIVKYFIS